MLGSHSSGVFPGSSHARQAGCPFAHSFDHHRSSCLEFHGQPDHLQLSESAIPSKFASVIVLQKGREKSGHTGTKSGTTVLHSNEDNNYRILKDAFNILVQGAYHRYINTFRLEKSTANKTKNCGLPFTESELLLP